MTYELSTDPARVDVDRVHGWLSDESYWARGRTRETTDAALAGSLVLGAYAPDGEQAGFVRVITDRATFAYLCDVFVFPEHRGRGLGTRMLSAVLALPELAPVKSWLLSTSDAHGVYERFGFGAIDGQRWMTMRR